ncbi:MAG TPA: hypothetical protein VMR29_06460, partial [Candidatus Binatia bacterium]|nr:hypothetical protein [Candidatus Binatia bacterium]
RKEEAIGFVKSREEIARLQAALAEPRFYSAQMVAVEYSTKPEIIRRVLPPGRPWRKVRVA